MKKTLIILLFFFAVILAVQQVSAYSGGDGSSSNPYQITTIEDLWDIRDNPDVNYTLMNDLDFESNSSYSNPAHKTGNITGSGWLPIGAYSWELTGSFNGNNHTISNLFIHRNTDGVLGLFWVLNGSCSNLIMVDTEIQGADFLGTLAGSIEGTVFNVHVINSTINSTIAKTSGGFVGMGNTQSHIHNCSSIGGNVNGLSDWYSDLGGFIGLSYGLIETCYTTTNVTTLGNASGGFAGSIVVGSNVTNCYAMGNVSGWSSGGFVAYTEQNTNITNCYSTGNVTGLTTSGFCLNNTGTITNCFFDNETSGHTASYPNNATGKNTSDMQEIKIFSDAGWSIANATEWIGEIWYIPWMGDYPKFPPGTVTFNGNPANNSVEICPCCEPICCYINSSFGNPLNMSIYARETGLTFNEAINWTYITDGRYCFCMNGLVTPMKYNTTYQWYIVATDTVTHLSYFSDTYAFTTTDNISNCSCIGNIEKYFEEEDIEEGIIAQMEENEMISIIFFVIALGLLILSLLMEAYHTGGAEYDNIIMVLMVLSIILFFVSAAAFVVNETNAYAFMAVAMGFIAIVFLAIKASNLLGSNEE